MAEVKSEHVTIIANNGPATKDGTVIVEVTKFAPWFEMHWNRQGLTHGITAIPSGTLLVEVPVEGVLEGGHITPDQLAELLVGLMNTVLPTCKVFVESVEEDFGFDSEKKDF